MQAVPNVEPVLPLSPSSVRRELVTLIWRGLIPLASLAKGGTGVKVSLGKGDLGGSSECC